MTITNNRIWVYLAARPLTKSEAEAVTSDLNMFLSGWAAHGKPLSSHAIVLHDVAIVIEVDEDFEEASGCSIDKLTHFIKNLSDKLDLDLFNRRRVVVLADGKTPVITSLDKLAEAGRKGEIKHDDVVMNASVGNKTDYESFFLSPLAESPYAAFL